MKLIRIVLLPFLVAAITFAPIVLTPSDALSAQANNSVSGVLSVGAGNFVAFSTTAPSGANPMGPTVLLNQKLAQYFYVRNSGNIDISALTINITYTTTPNTLTFRRCDAKILFSATNTCTSGAVTLILGSGAISLSLPASSWIAFEVDPGNRTTPTVSISVSSLQIRPHIITNS